MKTKLYEGQIIFYYAHDDIFHDVRHQSAFLCKNITSKEGGDISEAFLITEDETDTVALCLREQLPAVFEVARGLTYGIPDATQGQMTGAAFKLLFPDATQEEIAALGVDDAKNYVVIRLMDNGAYNPNDPALVDSAFLSAIEQGVLAEYYAKVTHPVVTKVCAEQFGRQLAALSQRLLGLRKKSSL